METSPFRSRRPESTRGRIAVQKSICTPAVAAKFLSSRLSSCVKDGSGHGHNEAIAEGYSDSATSDIAKRPQVRHITPGQLLANQQVMECRELCCDYKK